VFHSYASPLARSRNLSQFLMKMLEIKNVIAHKIINNAADLPTLVD